MHASALVWIASSLLSATSGDVEIVVRDPDGKLVANRMARVVEFTPFGYRGSDAATPREIRTDAEGRARIPVEAGLRRLNIRVAGVGFGATGLFEVREGHIARPDLPRLARFARVEGKVDPALFSPGTKVEGSHSKVPQRSLDDLSVPCDADGRFVFEEVIPGELHLRLLQHQPRIAVERTDLLTEPGQTRRGVVLGPSQPPDPEQEREEKETLDRFNSTKSKEEITWVEGTVLDTRGTPLQNAEVLVKAVYYPGMRNYSDVRTTHTDAQGHFQIRGPHWNFRDSLIVVVRIPGRAPVLAYARAPGRDDKGPRGPLVVTVPDHGGALAVRVLKDGKALANVAVALREQRLVERIRSRPTGDQQALHKLFNPVERTDKEGVARFTALYPSLYQLRAIEDASGLGEFAFPGTEGVARADIPAVAIAAGEELSMTVALHREPGRVTLQALRPDGTPPVHHDITFFFGLREARSGTTMDFDAHGVGSHRFDHVGLWAVGLHFRETMNRGLPANWEPFYQGSTLLAVSPGYRLEAPVKVTCEPHLPGSIEARLVGLDGKPARGTILLLNGYGLDRDAIDRAASTDEEGVARFTDLTSGDYRIRASMEAYPPPYRPWGRGPLPDDAALRDQVVFPVEAVKVESGQQTRVQLQPVKVGYVRVRIKPALGAKVSDYYPMPTHDWMKVECYLRRDAAGGEYLCGPLLPGKVGVPLRRRDPDKPFQDISHSVPLAPGEVAHLDLEAKGEPARSNRPEQFISLGIGGISTLELPPEAMAGTVVHSDGKTPAFGARAVLVVPGESRPTASATTDAAGRLTWTGFWIMRGNSSAAADPPGRVTAPTVVVSLPGLAGAAVIPIDPRAAKPFRAVLPPPLDASGRVTLGGRAITSQNARVRVIAGHQGSGVLDGPLSVEATVQADGRFTLRGLAPGTYQVQAARDGIWLSRSVRLRISPDLRLADLSLDIPEPGAAVTLALVDDRNRPAGRRRLKLARPEGPLKDLWPEFLTTGAAGTLDVRGLEVGTHQFLIEGEDSPRSFEIPSASQGPARLIFAVKANQR
jgi:hypothetical protein